LAAARPEPTLTPMEGDRMHPEPVSPDVELLQGLDEFFS
jgi:hypothetical protein